uniref:non-specific serine/threonine protein kinase n=1 Tax=Triticum urartu TaxID=4572 RepID=A0A8R7TFW2_TRIUA
MPEGKGGAGDVAMALKSVWREAARHKKSGGSGSGDGHRRIWFERDVLLALRHPLLPALHDVLATDAVVGFAIDRCGGDDLNSLRRRQTEKMFSDSVIRDAAKILVASHSTAPDSKLKVFYKKYLSDKLGGVALPD